MRRRKLRQSPLTCLVAAVLTSLFTVVADAEFRLEHVRESLTGTHCRYREYVDGIATDQYVVRPCTASTQALVAAPAEHAAERIVAGRRVRRVIVEESPLEPFAYDYDAATGVLVRKTPLFFRATANVFKPNPVVALNDPTLQDRNDSVLAVPPSAYSVVELQGVAPFGPLRGPHATLVDRQPPSVDPPDAAASLVFDREDDGFEDVNAYFHVDATQRYLQSLGYVGRKAIVPYSIEIDAHAISGADNSLFLPSAARAGYGTLFFGEGGTDDAEDADLLVHEYTHAILEWIAPGTFGGAFPSQARALAEGYGDYWAWSAHVDERRASGRDPYCFADWDARCWEDTADQRCSYPPGSDCLRRLDGAKTMADYQITDRPGVEHENGTIWSSALREIRDALGRETTDRLVLESLFAMPPQPTLAAAARRLLLADGLLHGGANAAVLCTAMNARGILEGCGDAPRGDLALWQSTDRAIAIPENSLTGAVSSITITDARAIERLLVRVDIDHSARGDLRIELLGPDGTRVILQPVSFERTADVHTTFGLDTASYESLDVFRGRSAAGVWQLVVRDLRPLDQGQLLSWGLLLTLEGDAPDAVRPRGTRTQMIPVVAHVVGVGGSEFRSDVRLANVGASARQATLIFTPSGSDGTASFASANVVLAPGQTVALDDVVASLFFSAGSGSLEIVGDVLVSARIRSPLGGGTVGQHTPAVLHATRVGEARLFAAAIPGATTRVNAGITEIGGAFGVVRVNGRDLEILPYSHIQFPAGSRELLVEVVSGAAVVAAYLSQVNATTNDAVFVAAEPLTNETRTLLAPVITDNGFGAEWLSDLWFATRGGEESATVDAIAGGATHRVVVPILPSVAYPDVLARLFHRTVTTAALRVEVPPYTFAMTQVRNGELAQGVPMTSPAGPSMQHLLFVERNAAYRTNIGIVSEGLAVAEVVVFDSAGRELGRDVLGTEGGMVQVPVTRDGGAARALVQFLEGAGRAWASLVDNRTSDATYVAGQ